MGLGQHDLMWSGYLRSGFRASLAFVAACAMGGCVSQPSYSRWLTPEMLEELQLQQEYSDFLVARYAGLVGDSASAATFYGRAFANTPEDGELLELAAFATMAAGDMAGATRIARAADATVAVDAPSAQVALVIDDIARGRTKEAQARLSNPGVGIYNADLRGALGAWLAAQTDIEEALAIVEWITPPGGMRGDRDVLRALVLMEAKLDAEALTMFERARGLAVSAPDVVFSLGAQLAASRGETERARDLLAGVRGAAASAVLADLAAGKKFARPELDAKRGAALVIHVVSANGRTRLHPETNLMRQAAALHLDPDLAPARLMQAEALEGQDRPDEALAALRLVKAGSPWRADALIQQAEMLGRIDRGAEGIALADEAATSARRDIKARAADVYRFNDAYPQAVALYDRIVAEDAAAGAADWRVLFARATARNAAGDWPGAEADLLAAIALEPDQPELLNSLGYNWVDRGERVEEGMALVQRAVAARPDLGHIVDSYGWAHFKLGHYDQAIPYLERAAEILPTDAEVVDHLGDAYWAAGRQKEARYSWAAALRLKPDAQRETSLKEKLASGPAASASASLAASP